MKTRLERGKSMKNKKGFTLIELLAVIVILAIIALIAVPTVMNIISSANKSAFKDSAYGVLKAGEYYYMEELLNAQGMTEDITFIFPDNAEGLEINGSKPTGGAMTVNKKGQIAMAITNGRYCVTKGYEDDDVTITDGVENCKLPGYNVGDVVYYNPIENKICTDYVEANSTTGVKEGCMKWYVYATNGGEAKLILDHNTTGKVAWVTRDDYEDAGGTDWVSGTYGQYVGKTSKGPITLMNQLEADTTNWEVEADIIELSELLNMLTWYQKLSDKTNWEESYKDAYEAAEVDVNENVPYENDMEVYQERNEYLEKKYSDMVLPNYMYDNLLGICGNVGNEEDGYYLECDTYGYWTKTATTINTIDYGNAWDVGYSYLFYNGLLNIAGVSDEFGNGVRPVITLSK